MDEAIKSLLIPAVGVMISPLTIAATIFLLKAKKKVSSIVFAISWMLGTLAVYLVSAFLSGAGSSGSGQSKVVTVILLALSAMLFYLSISDLIKYIKAKGKVEEPALFKKLVNMTTSGLIGYGLIFCIMNDKNLLLAIAGGAKVSSLALSTGEIILTGLIFILIGCWTVYVPILANFILKDKMDNFMDKVNNWLMKYNNIISFVIFFVIGLCLLLEALGIL